MNWIADERVRVFKKALLKMGWYCEKMFLLSIEAFQTEDEKIARQVIEDDNVLDEMEIEVRQEATTLLGVHQLNGLNLRFVAGGIQIANTFERIGDTTRRISENTVALIRDHSGSFQFSLMRKISQIAAAILKESLRVLADLNVEGAIEICARDAEVDELFEEIRCELTENMAKNSENIRKLFLMLDIAQSIEEIADLSTNIVESTIYIVKSQAYKCLRDEMKPFKGTGGVLFEDSD